MNSILLVGGGGHCRSCIDVIESSKRFSIRGILDIKEKIGEKISEYEIIDSDSNAEQYIQEECFLLITIGQIQPSEKRKELFLSLKERKGKFSSIISTTSYTSPKVQIGEGSIILHKAFVNANVNIGVNCIINSGAIIEHDVELGNHSCISPGSIINGGAKIGEGAFIGSGAIVIQGAVVPNGYFVKAGTVFK